MKKRLLGILLTVCMVLSMLPVSAFATDGNAPIGTSGIQEGTLCEHHTQHDAACGFVMAQAAMESTEEIPCNMECVDTDDNAEINHADGCAYAPATVETPAVEGVSCGFVCEECAAADNIPVVMTYEQVIELFEALPKADSITAETSDEDKQAAYDKLGKAMAAFEELSEDEQKQFLTENEALYLAVMELNDAITGNTPKTLDLDTPDLTVTFNGTTTVYNDFATAWAAAIATSTCADVKATITLNKDISAAAPFSNTEDYLVLDTNGHTLDFGSFSGNSRITNSGGSLEIIGSGKLTGSSSKHYGIGVLNVANGTVKVTDATIQNTGSNGSVAVIVNGGEFHFFSGKLISGEEYALSQNGNAKIYLYSGTIQSSGRYSLVVSSAVIMPSEAPLILISKGVYHSAIASNLSGLNFSKVEIADLKYDVNADGSNLTTKTDNVYDGTVNASRYVTITKKARQITYAITAPVATNGSYTVMVGDTAVSKAAEGATVIITPTADSGYELDSIKIAKTYDGSDVTSTVNWNATAKTFTMPAYAVTVNVNFKKIPTASDFTFTAPASLDYSGSGKSATVTAASSVSGMGAITVEYYSDATKLSSAPTDIGNYTVKINVAVGDSYAGATGITDGSWAFTITPKGYVSSEFTISTITDQTYTSSEIEPALEVKLGDDTLVSGTDYILSYSDNINAGHSAKVAIEFKGNFSGKAEKTFTILPLDISAGATVDDFTAMTYSGEAQTPSATVTKGTLTATGTWSDVTNVADKTTFTASGNFTGTIAEKATGMAALSVSNFTVGTFAAMTYSSTEQTPFASVTKEALTATGTWSNVTNVADKTTFTASGNFTGTISDKTTSMKKAVVSDLDLYALIAAPSKNATAQTTLANQTQYTGNITWSPALPASGKFLGETAYTATLTLVPTENYTLTGVAENSFTYTGASATNGTDSGTVSIVFAKTGPRVVESIAITGTPTKTTYHFGEAFDAAGITITATYDDGKTAEIKSGYTVSPSTMQGDTTKVTITYGDKIATVNGFTVKENLSSIATPAAILGVANGAAKSTSALNLPSTVSIVTSKALNPTTTATVNWEMDSVTYDPSLLTEQSFTVNGTITLPTDVTNVDNVSLCVAIAVTVNAANTVTKPALDATANPTDTSEKITGLTDNQKVSPNSTLTITADSFIRGDKTYIPVAWKTNPEGTFGVSVGNTYSATVNTSGMTTGAHTFTVIYREVETTTGTPTGNIVETAISYTLKSAGSGSTGGGSSTVTTYTITATAGAGGSISTEKSVSVREGDNAGFTFTPNKGYQISDVLVNGRSVGAVKNYVFANVRANHTIEVTFMASSGHVNPQTGVAFKDVSENDWFYDSVYNVVNNGWFAGASDKAFAPHLSTTRGMIATVLHRVENEPTATAASIFEDVASGAYYTSGVNWAQENSIVSGYGNGKFGPQDNITREQMAAILYRYAQVKGYDITKTTSPDSFSDAGSVSTYAVDPMKWAIANGLITGKGNGVLDPKGEATRAQVAAILTRFDEIFSEE